MRDDVQKFIDAFAKSMAEGTFIRLTLGNYKGSEEHLQKVHIRPVRTKKGDRLFFLYRYETRDTAKNYASDEGQTRIGDLIASGFQSGHLFTAEHDIQLEIGKRGRSRLNIAKPTLTGRVSLEHDRQKRTLVDQSSFYLRALGITTDEGKVRDRQQDKWRQINKFVEVLASLIEKSRLRDRRQMSIVDMGCGKGYLTFAAYDYLAYVRGLDVTMTGVDSRPDLVAVCSDVAAASGFAGLNFVVGDIGSFDMEGGDVMIALHACDTATDDAIFKGVAAGAELIVTVPCCHRELRPQIEPPPMMRDILKHGVMLERTAEMLTDGIRSLLLEAEGYATRLFEFVAVEHTPKNNMLVATRLAEPANSERFFRQIALLKDEYGIRDQRLETLLAARSVLLDRDLTSRV